MVKPWGTQTDVVVAVDTIQKIMQKTNALPEDLVAAEKRILKGATHGQVALFYKLLAAQCPEALHYFMGVL
jgi:hypothetical protein